MLYTEIILPTFVLRQNGASMGQTQTASTIETTAAPTRIDEQAPLDDEKKLNKLRLLDTSSLVELLEVMPFPKTLNLYSAGDTVQNFGILRATNT